MFLKGLLIALIFGLPAGSIGVLCVNNSIQKGFIHGFVTGLGSTLADTFYAVIGAFGISIVSAFLQQHEKIIASVGGALIIAFGIVMMTKKQKTDGNSYAKDSASSLLKELSSSFVIAILNPAAVLTFMVAFTSFGINCQSLWQSVLLVSGIFTGTVLWWLFLSFVSSRFKQRFSQRGFRILHFVCGTLLILFGLICILKVNL